MPAKFFTFRHSKPSQIQRKLLNLIGLRNLMCHFNGSQDVRHMDVYLENIHELAVLFYDEPRALLARALRDRLHAEAERTLQEIETLTMLTTLPEAGDPWLLHHRNTVCNAVDELARGYHLPSQKHPILVAAAREWAAHEARWPAHHMGWEYGTSIPIPEVEDITAARAGSSDEAGLSGMMTEGRSLDEADLSDRGVSEPQKDVLDEEDSLAEDFILVDDVMLKGGDMSEE
ncbi:hypothetical protein KVR01_007916 [Diaporthe batatas]|uniref:uncharacterized protein n=1 Tax=Diaporthe batatas TaxID=748121 RepID=UPI001D04DA2C|nr:uncharacterized protein KVR01_007916 [Diaporthe batatas]KAG8162151.1 hypothetical protein KVR01_007916 [Diaporthe batatas]